MDFDYSDKVERLRAQLSDFMRFHVEPANVAWHRDVAAGRYPLALIERLKSRAFSEDLWNLFLPGLGDDDPGQRLTNLEYAPLAEIMGRIHWASEVFNCNAPDTGNMELLQLAATPEQRAQWLRAAADRRDPLLLRDERTRRRLVRRPQHPHHDHPRRRRLRGQRPQMVHHRRRASELQAGDRDGRHRRASRCRTRPSGIRCCWCRWTRPG